MSNGILYIVATPIGHLDDLSPRALKILNDVAYIAAEDTRHSAVLLRHFGITTPCLSLHEHNEEQRCSQIINYLQQGQSIAVISDAGTPLISDPGFRVVNAARAADIKVVPIPGPCALITALCASGLPSDRFAFEGFLPAKSGAKQKQLESIRNETRTIIFYESTHRLLDTIDDMIQILGEERYVVIARELTKTFETIHGDPLSELKKWLLADSNQQKGEFVLLVKGLEESTTSELENHALKVLNILMTELSASQAVKLAAKITGVKKSWLYEQTIKNKE